MTTMAAIRTRLERLENKVLFNHWLRFQRWLETLTIEELEDFASNGIYPDPFPDPPPGSTSLDKLDRKALIKLWEEDQRWYAGRGSAEFGFYAEHGHWPEQACAEDCRKPASDKLRTKSRMENTDDSSKPTDLR
jgi:hypothetical protein